MNRIYHIWWKSVISKPRQDRSRHDKAWQGKARRGQTKRRPDKKVSPGCEKYCSTLSSELLNLQHFESTGHIPYFSQMSKLWPVFYKYSVGKTMATIYRYSTYNALPQMFSNASLKWLIWIMHLIKLWKHRQYHINALYNLYYYYWKHSKFRNMANIKPICCYFVIYSIM